MINVARGLFTFVGPRNVIFIWIFATQKFMVLEAV